MVMDSCQCGAEEEDEETPGDGNMHETRIALAEDTRLNDSILDQAPYP